MSLCYSCQGNQRDQIRPSQSTGRKTKDVKLLNSIRFWWDWIQDKATFIAISTTVQNPQNTLLLYIFTHIQARTPASYDSD